MSEPGKHLSDEPAATEARHRDGTTTAARLGDVTVPTNVSGVGHMLAWLSLFLLGLMALTGVLLATLYVPSAAPATGAEGTPHGLAVATDTVSWLGRSLPGEILTLPLNVTGDSLEVPPALSGRVRPLRDGSSSRIVRPSAAWQSVEQTIQRHAEMGWLVRGIHRYAAGLLVASVLLHLLSTLVGGGWRRPRRSTWVGGIALLVLVMAFAFSGSILPWSRLSFVAARIGAGFAADALPWIGPAVAGIIRGGADVGQATLTRFHALHTILLPLLTLSLLLWHLALVRRHGLVAPTRATAGGRLTLPSVLAGVALTTLVLVPVLTGVFDAGSPVVQFSLVVLAASLAALTGAVAGPRQSVRVPLRVYLYRDLVGWVLLTAALVTIVVVVPVALDDPHLPVDITAPVVTPEGVHPEWYLRWAYDLVSVLPAPAALVTMLLVLVGLGALGVGRTHPVRVEEDRAND